MTARSAPEEEHKRGQFPTKRSRSTVDDSSRLRTTQHHQLWPRLPAALADYTHAAFLSPVNRHQASLTNRQTAAREQRLQARCMENKSLNHCSQLHRHVKGGAPESTLNCRTQCSLQCFREITRVLEQVRREQEGERYLQLYLKPADSFGDLIDYVSVRVDWTSRDREILAMDVSVQFNEFGVALLPSNSSARLKAFHRHLAELEADNPSPYREAWAGRRQAGFRAMLPMSYGDLPGS